MAKFDFKKSISESVESSFKKDALIGSENIKRNIIKLEALENYIPQLTKEESTGLEQNIIENGCRTPLIVWMVKRSVIFDGEEKNDELAFVLVDGHNRHRICKKNNIDFSIDIMSFDNLESVKEFMLDFQINRRNITAEQAAYLRGKRYNKEKRTEWDSKKTDSKGPLTREILAKQFKVSPATIARDAKFAAAIDLLPEETKKEILTGEKKISKSKIYSDVNIELNPKVKKFEIDFLKKIIVLDGEGNYFIPDSKFKIVKGGINIIK